jgi:hypothetical protein
MWYDKFVNWFKSILSFFGWRDEKELLKVNLSSKHIKCYLNDPSTPKLVANLPIPLKPGKMDFKVKNYKGGGYALGTTEGRAAGCFVTMANSIQIGRSYCPKRLIRWPGTKILFVLIFGMSNL